MPINPLTLLAAATYADKVRVVVDSAAESLLADWRDKGPGKTDDQILRNKLAGLGFKFSRQKDRWVLPDHPDVRAPRTLRDLSVLAAKLILEESLKKEEG